MIALLFIFDHWIFLKFNYYGENVPLAIYFDIN